ncbi:MAG: glycosyltransferase family 2 protein [Candidatus Binatia bacterium]
MQIALRAEPARPAGWQAPVPASVRGATFLILPAFNEAPVIGGVVSELCAGYPNVVVVDDGSEDATSERARDAGAVVLRHAVNRGQGAAIQTGLEYALREGARYLVTFDSDGQHRAEDVAAVLAPITEGRAEIVLGSRFLGDVKGIPWSRRWLLRPAVVFTRLVSGVRVTDSHNGLRALSRRAASQIHISLDRMAHASEIIDQVKSTGLPYVEVPVHVRYTGYSRAKGQPGRAAITIAFEYLLSRILR